MTRFRLCLAAALVMMSYRCCFGQPAAPGQLAAGNNDDGRMYVVLEETISGELQETLRSIKEQYPSGKHEVKLINDLVLNPAQLEAGNAAVILAFGKKDADDKYPSLVSMPYHLIRVWDGNPVTDAQVKYSLGCFYINNSSLEKAISCFEDALKQDAQYLFAVIKLARAYNLTNQPDKAIALILGGGSAFTDNAKLCFHLSSAYSIKGERAQAVEYARKAVELAPDFPAALFNSGVFYYEDGDDAQAQDCLMRAKENLASHPGQADEDFYVAVQDIDNYLLDIKFKYALGDAISGEYDHAQLYLNEVLSVRADDMKARDSLNLVERIKTGNCRPDYPRHFFTGMLHIMRNAHAEALQEFTQAYGIEANAPVRLYLGYANFNLGRWDTAIDYFREVIKLEPENAFAAWHLGLCLSQAGNKTAALEELERARELYAGQGSTVQADLVKNSIDSLNGE